MTDQKLKLPNEEKAKEAFWQFCKTIAHLRQPDTGCPWDLKQTHSTLRKFIIEESYEAVEVMTDAAGLELADELGDVLLQVVLNAQLADDRGSFSMVDVCEQINNKMRHRHPHVFQEGFSVKDADEVKDNWQKIKATELAVGSKAGQLSPNQSAVFAKAYGKGPATYQAEKIGKIAAKVAFDWSAPKEVLAQLREEIDELEAELAADSQGNNQQKIVDEVGDVYFSLAQLARHLKVDPEMAALQANQKFLRRFSQMETFAKEDSLGAIEKLGTKKLEDLWQRAKKAT